MTVTLRVAAIQPTALNEGPQHNLAHAEPLVARAKAEGAELVLLPEFYATGYMMTPAIWDWAESSHGFTTQWLKQQARKHHIWIGTSFLEAEGSCFFNTFILMDQLGKEVIRVRKSKPAAVESFFFEGYPSTRVVDSPWGRIGISICYESFLASTLQQLRDEGADMVLVPMSAPTPSLNWPITADDLEEYNLAVKNIATDTAMALGLPVVMANKSGEWKTATPSPFPDEDSTFPGLSTIAAANGEIIAALGAEEGIAVGNIELNPERKVSSLPQTYGKWVRKPPGIFKLFVISETIGRLSYLFNLKRHRMARLKSKG